MKFATLNLILLPLVFVAPGWLLALWLRVDSYRGNAWRQIFHAFVLSIVANSLLITLLLTFDHFSPQLILNLNGIAGIGALVMTAIRAPALNVSFNHRTLIAAALILIAFCLRLPPSFHTTVFDDGGAYVNAAGVLLREGKIFYPDPVLNQISSPAARAQYLKDNTFFRAFDTDISEQATYWFDTTRGIKHPQFPALFPAWMALFGHVLGLEQMVIVVPLFAVLAIVAMAMLAIEATNSLAIGALCGAFATFSAMSVFYGGYPVSEVPSAFLIFSAWYFLTRAMSENGAVMPSALAAAACYGAFFFTRISGFLHFPLLAAIGLYTAAFVPKQEVRRAVLGFLAATLLFWALSIAYYFHFNGPYIEYHLVEFHKRVFGESSLTRAEMFRQLLQLLVGVIGGFWVLMFPLPGLRTQKHAAKIVSWAGKVVFIGTLFVGLWCMWKLTQSETVIHTGVSISPSALSYQHANIYQLALQLSWAGLALAIGGTFVLLHQLSRNQDAARVAVLSLAVVAFTGYSLCFTKYTWYNFYYGRYLISETVPLLTIAAAVGFFALWQTGNSPSRLFAKLSANLFTGAALLAFIWQIGPLLLSLRSHPEEQHGAALNFRRLAALAPDLSSALVLMDRTYVTQSAKHEYPAMADDKANFELMLFATTITPLRQVYGVKLANTFFPNSLATEYSKDGSCLLISAQKSLEASHAFLSKLGAWPVSVNWHEKTAGFPRRFLEEPRYLDLYVYRVDLTKWKKVAQLH